MSKTVNAVNLTAELTVPLTQLLHAHHTLYTQPVTGTAFEELLNIALSRTDFGSSWLSGSHSVSTDLTLSNAGDHTISAKSGELKDHADKQTLTVSGSRLGQYKQNLTSMLKHVDASAAQTYVCLSRKAAQWNIKDQQSGSNIRFPSPGEDKIYNLFIFSATLLDYASAADWKTRTTSSGNSIYALDHDPVRQLSAEIRSSMSHQLWTTIDVSLIGAPTEIIIPGRSTRARHVKRSLSVKNTVKS